MMRAKLFAAALAAAVAVSNAHAQSEFESGNSLYAKLTGDQADRLMAMSYIVGIHDAYAAITICAPDGITKGQLADMIRNLLANNPAQRHRPASILINDSLSKLWPCKNNKSQGQGV